MFKWAPKAKNNLHLPSTHEKNALKLEGGFPLPPLLKILCSELGEKKLQRRQAVGLKRHGLKRREEGELKNKRTQRNKYLENSGCIVISLSHCFQSLSASDLTEPIGNIGLMSH